jgi:uncharacterized protein (DUF983 family)
MRLSALLKQRCPHCLQGQVFNSLWKMNATCPNCGIKFEREDGYFMMSVFIGYVISAAIALPIRLLIYLLKAPLQWYFISSIAVIILLIPLIFRYARLIWMHLDEILDPRSET